MKRRKALQHLAIISSGVILMPACSVDKWPVFENLSLKSDQMKLLEQVAAAILPKADPELVVTPEPTAHFILGIVNNCFEEPQIREYELGLKLFQQHVQDEYHTAFDGLNPEQHMLLFTEITHSPIFPKSLKYFLNTTKQLTVQHFTTSEYFMKNHLKFEFIPGRFHGCVPV